jgi:H+/gluconate symporter-like permease
MHTPLAGPSTTSTLIAAVVGAVFTLVAVYFGNKFAEQREERNQQTLESLHKADREATEQVHRDNREDNLHREQLRELRPIVDDATRALFDLWSALGAFLTSDTRAQSESRAASSTST